MKSEYKGFVIAWVPRFEKYCLIDYPHVLAEFDTYEEARKFVDERLS